MYFEKSLGESDSAEIVGSGPYKLLYLVNWSLLGQTPHWGENARSWRRNANKIDFKQTKKIIKSMKSK